MNLPAAVGPSPGRLPERRHGEPSGRRARRLPPRNGSVSTTSTPASGSGSAGCGSTSQGSSSPRSSLPKFDSSVLVGYQAAETYLDYTSVLERQTAIGHPTEIYVRAQTSQVAAVTACSQRLRTPNPPTRSASANRRTPSSPRPRPRGAFNGLFLGLGAVAAARRRDRRGEHHGHLRPRAPIRDRAAPRPRRHEGPDPHPVPRRGDPARAAGWRRGIGGGALATAIYAQTKHWTTVIPALAWGGGIGGRTRHRKQSPVCSQPFAPRASHPPTHSEPHEPRASHETRRARGRSRANREAPTVSDADVVDRLARLRAILPLIATDLASARRRANALQIGKPTDSHGRIIELEARLTAAQEPDRGTRADRLRGAPPHQLAALTRA